MFMLWRAHLKERLSAFFHPESSRKIKRLQLFWLGSGTFVIVVVFYGIFNFLFEKAPVLQEKEEVKPTPTSIETVTKKINLEEAFRHNIEGKLKVLSDEVSALKTLFQEGLKGDETFSEQLPPEKMDEDQPLGHSTVIQELETKILHLEQQLEMQKNSPSSNNQFASQSFHPHERQEENLIQKTSLALIEHTNHKLPKTVDTTIPAGAFAKTILLSGLDASSAMNASSDPRPMLLRLIDFGTLPRRFQSDLKDCHCTASAYGDLSSERIYARLEKLTCVVRHTGEIIETQVAGYIAGSDGKAGIRGVVASKDGQFLSRSLMGGFFSGLSNVANPASRRGTPNPFSMGGAGVPPISMTENFTSGMATGATTALDRLSQYYIDRAEQLQPVIQVAAGQVVDVVFTEGTLIGSQDVHEELKTRREASHQTPDIHPQKGD